MKDRTVSATTFKAKCLALLDQVAEAKVSLVITKRGRPVARVVPADDGSAKKPLLGSVKLLSSRPEDYYSTGEAWDLDDSWTREESR